MTSTKSRDVVLLRLQINDFIKTSLFYLRLSHEIRNAENVRRFHYKDSYQNEKDARDQKTKMNKQWSSKRVVESDDEHVNENELNIKNSEHLFDFRFQFEDEKSSMNRRRIDRSKMSEKNKKRSW